MEKRRIGKSGLEVSTLGLGTNNFGGRSDAAASRAVVRAALDHGVNFFDTADTYPGGDKAGTSEELLGKSLGADRGRVVIASKFGKPSGVPDMKHGGGRRYIKTAVERSLKRLNTGWIDLYFMHEPDPLTPIEETLRALEDLVREGKVLYVACSNFAAWQITDAHWQAKASNTGPFIATQDEYSILSRGVEREIIPAIAHCGMGLIPFFPLASGALTGKYRPGEAPPPGSRGASTPRLLQRATSEEALQRVEKLRGVAGGAGISLADLAFGWLLAQKSVASVIAGASTPEQIAANAKSVEVKLSADVLAEIDTICPPGKGINILG